ncbi:MAG: hypothetical protein JOZ78_11705 [Chroococcidiopsidaceae cyanobacterium CP_BM_ER_R8_30]|nr:hypothetical protein [Chroococcidiopsidaceae cyanobacterium CP_BM_ER_R8_30]
MQPNRLRLLQVAEYSSFAASVLGVVISTASRQVVYAAAPLSLSIFLNLLNRQRFEQQTQQSITAIRAQVEQQSQLNQAVSFLQQEVASKSQQLLELDAKVTSEQQVRLDLWKANTQLEERLAQLTHNICDDIQLLRQQIPSEASILNLVASQLLDSFPLAEQVDSLKTEVDKMQAELVQLQALIKQLQDCIGDEQDDDEEDAELELELLAM